MLVLLFILLSSPLLVLLSSFAKVSQRFGLLPGAQGLNDISQVIEEGTQTIGSGSPLDQVRREAEVVADDVILNFGKEDLKKAPNKFCKTMRRTVKELSGRHDIAFKGMVNKLNLDSSNPFQTFVNVADEIFDDGQINWGRIVAVYTFCGKGQRGIQIKVISLKRLLCLWENMWPTSCGNGFLTMVVGKHLLSTFLTRGRSRIPCGKDFSSLLLFWEPLRLLWPRDEDGRNGVQLTFEDYSLCYH